MHANSKVPQAETNPRFALYTSSLGNYFFNEIRDIIEAGLVELGHPVERRDERAGFAHDADWHLIIAPHEFCELGAGAALARQPWPRNVILFNTEQPSSHWLKLSARHFDRASAIWDINFESALRICKSGYNCEYLPLGQVASSPLLQEIAQLPLHAETRSLTAEIRNTSGLHQPFAARPLDLLFLGHASGRREQYFTRHGERLKRLKCFFHKPNATRPMIPGQTTQMNTLTSVGLAQRSKILLNIHHGVDAYFEWHRIVLLGIAQRTLVLTEPCTLAPPFEANRDFVEAPLDELPDRIEYYLGSKAGREEAQRIIDHGFATFTQRCRFSDTLRPLLEKLALPEAVCSAPAARYFPIKAPAAAAAPLALCVVTPDVAGEGPQADCGSAQVALAAALAEAGHKVTLLHTETVTGEGRSLSEWTRHFAQAGIQYTALPSDPKVPLDATPACRQSYETYLWLRARSFDVVHLPETNGLGFYSLLAKQQGLAFSGMKFCLGVHAPRAWQRLADRELVANPYELELDFLERESVRLADALTASTRFMMDWLEQNQWALPPDRAVRPDALPAVTCHAAASARPIRDLAYIGPVHQCPGLELFCDALDRLEPSACRNMTVTFVGSQAMPVAQKSALYLHQRTQKWSFAWRVVLLRPEDLPPFFLETNRLAVLPAPMQNSPLGLRRLLALGVPFLAVDGGGTAELIEPADRPQALCSAKATALAEAIGKALHEGIAPARPAPGTAESLRRWFAWHQQWASATSPRSPRQISNQGAEGNIQPASHVPGTTPSPLVSVCLVHFNRPELLSQALDSLRAQDYPNFEVVLIDDGSTRPEAVAFLAGLGAEFERRSWQIVQQENRYLGAARNTGARHARGEYLIFMDDDNIAKPNQISTFVRAALNSGAEILTSSMDLFTGTEPPGAGHKPKVRWIFLGGAAATGAIRNCFGDANGCIRRDTFWRLGGFTEDYGITHEDWEFYARAALAGCRLETVPEALFWYRVAEHSMIRSTSLFANLQRSLRPYIAAVPAPLRGLIQYVQGVTCAPPKETAPIANHDALLRLHGRLIARARELIRSGQAKVAEAMFLEVLESAELAGNSLVLLQTLLDVGRALVESDRQDIAVKVLQNAVDLARAGCEPRAIKEAQALLAVAKSPRSSRGVNGNAKAGKPSTAVREISPRAALITVGSEIAPISGAAGNTKGCAKDVSEACPAQAPTPASTSRPQVSIVIPCFNNLHLTRKCLAALTKNTPASACEVIVVDNASTDGTAEYLRANEVTGALRAIINQINRGFAHACNQGAQAARGSLVLFLNNDTEVTRGWLEPLAEAVLREKVGVAGAKLLYADGTIQHAGIGFINGLPDHPHRHAPGAAPQVNEFRELDMVTGACLMIRRELFVQLAGFDESYRNGVEDIDLCVRVRAAGYKVVYQPKSVVYHLEGQSAGRFNHVTENLRLFLERWGKAFDSQRRFVPPPKPEFVRAQRSVLRESVGYTTEASCRVAWEGSFLDYGSLSQVNRELTSQLVSIPGIELARIGSSSQPNSVPTHAELGQLAASLLSKPAEDAQIVVRHAWPPDWRRPHPGKLVVIQPWEYGALPVEWVQNSRSVDEFWVPSTHVRKVYIDSGIAPDKVKVVPNGIDPDRFRPNAEPMKLATQKSFKFLFVGGTIHRKGPDVLLRAYLETFTAKDDVCLVIKDFGGQTFYAGQTFEATIQAARSQPDSPEILYLTDELPPEALPGLYTACDCLVHPYRGEGFGLPVLEAMAAGLPVIVSAGGATDDFASDAFAYPIPAVKRFIGKNVSGMKLAGQGWLLDPDGAALAARMKWLAENRESAQAKGRLASEHARRDWTWQRSAEIAAERFQALTADTKASSRNKALPPHSASPSCAKSSPSKPAAILLPSCARVGHLGTARESLSRKKPREAWETTLAALKIRPFHPEAYLFLAEIADFVGDGQSARLCAEHAKRIAPGWKPARQFLNRRVKGNTRPAWLALPASLSTLNSSASTSGLSAIALKRSEDGQLSTTLSVCLITKNEEAFLPKCLASVKGLANQIVVVDTGSTDRTVQLAQEHDAEVHHFTWCDDFSAARNAALEHATGDWILMLDADEELSAEGRDRLLQHLREPATLAWRLPLVDVGRENQGRSYVPRLFRNAPALFYVGRVHEQVFSSIEVRRAEWGLENRLGEATLLHYGYAPELVRDRNKIQRNLTLLERAIAELPDEPHLLMSLGLELARSGREPEALERYRQAFAALSTKPAAEIVPELRDTLLSQFCTRLTSVKQFGEVVSVLNSPMARSGGGLNASLHFALGLAHLELGQPREAVEQMKQCLAKRNQRSLSPINQEIRTAAPFHCLALAYARIGSAPEARRAFEDALKEPSRLEQVRLDYARFLAGQNAAVEALQQLHEAVSENARLTAAWRLGGQLALSRPEFLEFARDWTQEAVAQLPQDLVLAAQRAEALLLSQDFAQAKPIWQELSTRTKEPAAHAAFGLCQILDGSAISASVVPSGTGAVDRAFIEWYRKLLAAGAAPLIRRLNEGASEIAAALPEAGRIIQAIAAETVVPAPAEPCPA